MDKKLLGMSALAGIIIVALEFVRGAHDASLLFALLFWVAVSHGIIAITAAAHISQGKWISPLKDEQLEMYPYMVVFPIAFVGIWKSIHMYDWTHHTTVWLKPDFFMIRNIIMLALMFIMAHMYISLKKKGSDKSRLFAVLYILAFVITHTLIAMDWVMSFEFPWISTMFGPIFFVEALYGATAILAIFAAIKVRKGFTEYLKVQKDFAMLMCGFGLFWGGLFFAQFLTIWYGNMPEEVAPLYDRISDPTTLKLGFGYLICLFLIPFVSFTGKAIKASPSLVTGISLIVLLGLHIERLVYLIPVAELNLVFIIIQWLILAIPFGLAFKKLADRKN